MDVAPANTIASLTSTGPEQLPALIWSVAIIVIAGVIGGFAALLSRDPATDPDAGFSPFLRYLMLGLVASACVPLFLSLVRSGIMTSILSNDHNDRLQSYLIFAGLCLLAAFLGRRFIDDLSQRVLQKVDRVEENVNANAADTKNLKDKVKEVAGEVEDVDAGATPAPEPEANEELPQNEPAAVPLTPEERSVLQALSRKNYRTRTGASDDSGIPINRISELLEDLAARKLALETKSPRTGGLRWAISKRGQAALTVGKG